MKMLRELEKEDPKKFFQEMYESHLIPSTHNLKGYTMRDMADFTFLYFIALFIMKNEFETAPVARRYAQRTLMSGRFDHFMTGATDLRIFLTTMLDGGHLINKLGEQEASQMLSAKLFLNPTDVRRFLKGIMAGGPTTNWDRQYLFHLEHDLHIDVSNYKSIRRLAVDWIDLKTNEKRLVMTRLLQAFRARARRSELLPYLEQIAKEEKLELKNVANPETGEQPEGKMSFLKKLAFAAAGAAAGMAAVNAMRNKKD